MASDKAKMVAEAEARVSQAACLGEDMSMEMTFVVDALRGVEQLTNGHSQLDGVHGEALSAIVRIIGDKAVTVLARMELDSVRDWQPRPAGWPGVVN